MTLRMCDVQMCVQSAEWGQFLKGRFERLTRTPSYLQDMAMTKDRGNRDGSHVGLKKRTWAEALGRKKLGR